MSNATASPILRWRQQNQSRLENWRRGFYRFRQSTLSMLGLVMVVFIFVVALTGPLWAPYPGDVEGEVRVKERFLSPGPTHLFGTDELGRDIFTLVVVGARVSLAVGAMVLISATLIGVVLGAIAGYFGGPINEVIMRVTDVFLTIPSLILAIAVAAALGPGIINTMLAISLVWWPGYCRLVQAEVSSRKQDLYVQAARAAGASHRRIIFTHILPNITSPIMVKISLDMGFAILTSAALGFVGVGARPPTPEWGLMFSAARSYIPQFWWYPVFPGLALFMTVFGFNLLGDGLRDVLDPRTKR